MTVGSFHLLGKTNLVSYYPLSIPLANRGGRFWTFFLFVVAIHITCTYADIVG